MYPNIGRRKKTEVDSGMDASPTNMGVSMGPTTDKKTEVAPVVKKAAPTTAPAVKKAAHTTAPVAKPTMKSAPTSKYRGGRSEKAIQDMIDAATPDRMRASQFAQDNPDATPFKKGGAVKSGASRGDGCAIRGRTKGKYC